MEISHQYVKKRDQFGHFCAFDDVPAQVLESIHATAEFDGDYVARNPVFSTVETDLPVSEHSCNTDLVKTRAQGMRHSEGGWPDNVDNTEPEQVDRFLKKASKEPKLKVRRALRRGACQLAAPHPRADPPHTHPPAPPFAALAAAPLLPP